MIVYDSNGQPYEADLVLGEKYREMEAERDHAQFWASAHKRRWSNRASELAALRAELTKAEARVGELEFGLKHQCETCEMKSIFDGEHDFAVKAQARVKELEADTKMLEHENDRLENENDRLERRRQYETDLVCAAVLEANAHGVSFGSAELCARVDELRALRARVAELETQNELLICDRARFPDKSCEVGNIIAAHIENLKSVSDSNAEAWRWACVREKALKERNAELVAALEEAVSTFRSEDIQEDLCRRLELLARAESATPDHIRDAAQMVPPAKHPDTVTEEGLTGIKFRDAKSEREVMLITEGEWRDWIACKHPDGLWVSMRVATEQDRAAIDAARKEVQHD